MGARWKGREFEIPQGVILTPRASVRSAKGLCGEGMELADKGGTPPEAERGSRRRGRERAST